MSTPRTQSFIDPVSITAIYTQISGLLKQLPLVGSIFRGKTQHLDESVADSKANEIGAKAMEYYFALDPAGKHQMYLLAEGFWNDFYARYSSWWDGFVEYYFESWNAKGWLANEETKTYHYISKPAFCMMLKSDVDGLQDFLQVSYVNRVNDQVWYPLADYVKAHYGTNLDTLVNQSKANSGENLTALAGSKSWWIVAGVATALGFAIYKMRKG